jgi:uncharacterized protein with NRDE domain
MNPMEQSTCSDITKYGRIALLTNLCAESNEIGRDKSRGAILSAYLDSAPCGKGSDDGFARCRVEGFGVNDGSGFSLLIGHLQPTTNGSIRGLSTVSNRTTDPSSLVCIATKPGEVHILSNYHLSDVSWPKIFHGEQRLSKAINISASRQDSRERFTDSLVQVLLIDTFPNLPKGQGFDVYANQMRCSIFIPRIAIEERCRQAATD